MDEVAGPFPNVPTEAKSIEDIAVKESAVIPVS